MIDQAIKAVKAICEEDFSVLARLEHPDGRAGWSYVRKGTEKEARDQMLTQGYEIKHWIEADKLDIESVDLPTASALKQWHKSFLDDCLRPQP